MNQKLGLSSPLSIRVIVRVIPIFCFHQIPVYLAQLFEVIEKIGKLHVRMPFSKYPTKASIPYGFDG